MSKSLDRGTTEYWEGRLFRNSFTYRGRRKRVPGWCIKIQWEGRRRTLRLESPDRGGAAREALALYRALRRGGWGALDAEGGGASGSTTRDSDAGSRAATPWPPLATRKYVGDGKPGFRREWFAELTAEGITEHVPLGTEDLNEARLRAMDRDAELRREGWASFRLRYPREATVAVFWQSNPMTCTYTTLLTIPPGHGSATTPAPAPAPAPKPIPPSSPAKGWRLLIVEPDGGVRRALARWLSGNPGVASVEGAPLAGEVPKNRGWDLVLAHRSQPPALLRDLVATEGDACTRVLTHGIFADSDAIFASFSGVSLGYLLRRVAPADLLAPLLSSFPDGPPRGDIDADRAIRRYFQAIFEPGGMPPSGGITPELTVREREILDLLGRGFADKEIAGALGISAWTVHSHLKRIFVKYGVRTRTEAVVRDLQK